MLCSPSGPFLRELSTSFPCTQEGFLAEDDAGAHDAYERERDEEADIKAVSAAAAAQHRADEAACVATTPGLAQGSLF